MGSQSIWLFYIIAIVAFVYFFMIRPNAKRLREQQSMLGTLEPGTRIMLTSGMFGTVQAVGERQLVVELAPGMEVTVLKQAVSRILSPDDEEFEYADDVDGEIADLLDVQDEVVDADFDNDDLIDDVDSPDSADSADRPDDWTK